MTDIVEQVKTQNTRPKVERTIKNFRLTADEKNMLAELSAVLGVNDSEAIRRMIKATYEAVVLKHQ